jgi:photosystem II stability/assembly factor-like uncharacterized protein
VPRSIVAIHRSRNGGRTWQALSNGLPVQESCAVLREALEIDAAEPCGLYVGTNGGQLFASADAGETWRHVAEVGASVRVLRVTQTVDNIYSRQHSRGPAY